MTNRARLGEITVGDGLPVAVAGALNVSRESFYPGSIATTEGSLVRAAEAMIEAGAAFVDVGAMSTAPYGRGLVPEAEEVDRLGWAVERLVSKLGVIISADTSRSGPARAALGAGARIINDVSGLTADPGVASLVAQAGASLVLMASERKASGGRVDGAEGAEIHEIPGGPIDIVRALLAESLAIARAAGIDPSVIAVDPGIGFFRNQGVPWHEWDCAILAGLSRLHDLGRPLCVGVSRKSFIGAIAGEDDPARRLPGSLAATALAAFGGAQVIRTHDVEETVQAVKVADAVRRARARM